MSLELLEGKPRKIIKMMPLLSAKMIYRESKMQLQLNQEIKYSKRKSSWKNKKKLLLPRPKQEKKR
jgi:hypothetical protein